MAPAVEPDGTWLTCNYNNCEQRTRLQLLGWVVNLAVLDLEA